MEQSYLWNALATSLSKTDWVVTTGQNGGKSGELLGDFQKMLEQKAQSAKPASTTGTAKEDTAPQKESTAPAQEQAAPEEDPQDMVRKLAEAGMVPVQVVNLVDADAVIVPEETAGGEELAVNVLGGEVTAELNAQTEAPMVHEQAREVELPEGAEVAEETPAQAEVQTIQDVPTAKAEEQVEVKPQAEAAVQVETGEEQTADEVEVTDAETAPEPVFRDVKAAPIKVADAPAAQESQQAGDVGEQVAAQLTNALAQGQTRVEIRLTPDSLGSVTIEITHSQDGGLHVALSAENNQTRGLLEKHAANLQGLLGRQSQEHVQVEVQRGSESQQQHNDQYDGHNGHNGQQPQEHRRQNRQEHDSRDFLQQLRLGLIPMEEES